MSFTLVSCFRLNYDQRLPFLFKNGVLVEGQDIRARYGNHIPSGLLLDNGLIEVTSQFSSKSCVVYYQYDPKTFVVKIGAGVVTNVFSVDSPMCTDPNRKLQYLCS